MAYPGYGAPPPGGYGGVSDKRVHCSLGRKFRDGRRSLHERGRHFESVIPRISMIA